MDASNSRPSDETLLMSHSNDKSSSPDCLGPEGVANTGTALYTNTCILIRCLVILLSFALDVFLESSVSNTGLHRPVGDFGSVVARLTAPNKIFLGIFVYSFAYRFASQYNGLDRPVTNSDITFLFEYCKVARMSLQIGWLMLRDFGYSIIDVRNVVMKDILDQPDAVKMAHVIESWKQLGKDKATARALVDICCHPTVGGDRSYIETILMSSTRSHGIVKGRHTSFI